MLMGCSPRQQVNARRVFAMGVKHSTAAAASSSAASASTSSSSSSSPASSPSKRASTSAGHRGSSSSLLASTTTLVTSLLLALLLTLAQPAAAAAGAAAALHPIKGSPFGAAALTKLDRQIQALIKKETINGARIVGAQHGRMVLDYTAGYNVSRGEPWFRLFSMTKPVTAVLTLVLQEEGILSIDDEFAKYVPELGKLSVFDGVVDTVAEEEEELLDGPDLPQAEEEGAQQPEQAQQQHHHRHHHHRHHNHKRKGFVTHPAPRNATIRELLTHTAGFAYGDNLQHPVDESYDRAMLQDFYRHTEESFLSELSRIPLLTEPGTEFHYSLGFDVLGIACSRAAGMPLDALMKQKIFDPLGMKDTGFFIPKDEGFHLAPMKEEEDFGTGIFNDIADAESEKGETDPGFKSGGGGLMATTTDYLRFAQMLLNGGELEGARLLRPESVAAMTSNQLPAELLPYHLTSFPGYNGSAFGFGVMVIDGPEVTLSAPQGEVSWAGMASNSWWISPRHGTALLAMTQNIPYHKELQDTVKPFFYDAFLSDEDRAAAAAAAGAAAAKALVAEEQQAATSFLRGSGAERRRQ